MIIQRPHYLQKLVDCRHNGMIKVLTSIRRCGKSFLLFQLYSSWLKEQGISDDHIIKIDLEDPSEDKIRQEEASLRNVDDSFKKIIVVADNIIIRRDEIGITTMGIYDFLLKENSLELSKF